VRSVVVVAFGVAFGVACGGSQASTTSAGSGDPQPGSATAQDTRSPIERRRDAACEQIGPELTACAVADTKADLAAGKITQAQFDDQTAAKYQHALTNKWIAGCETPKSSRQVRVLEVCLREEHDCDPLTQCLQNLQPAAK
jgi:hypothetical protein